MYLRGQSLNKPSNFRQMEWLKTTATSDRGFMSQIQNILSHLKLKGWVWKINYSNEDTLALQEIP